MHSPWCVTASCPEDATHAALLPDDKGRRAWRDQCVNCASIKVPASGARVCREGLIPCATRLLVYCHCSAVGVTGVPCLHLDIVDKGPWLAALSCHSERSGEGTRQEAGQQLGLHWGGAPCSRGSASSNSSEAGSQHRCMVFHFSGTIELARIVYLSLSLKWITGYSCSVLH